MTTETRATFYARRNGGGLRTARKQRKCEQFGCFKRIEPVCRGRWMIEGSCS